jgi:hypothetical protein
MEPHQLIGLPFRYGADPALHQATDCIGLTRTVLAHHGVWFPVGKRSWYVRLAREDWSVFPEQLALWGDKVTAPRVGAVGLCEAPANGLGLAVWWSQGWLSYGTDATVRWSPIDALPVIAVYCRSR